jgi:hypothetical protein
MASVKMEPELNESQPEPSMEIDPEAALLLANIDSALRGLRKVDGANDGNGSLASLEGAVHTYGSVKHLLPKLNLSSAQRVPVEEQLQKLRAAILAHNLY